MARIAEETAKKAGTGWWGWMTSSGDDKAKLSEAIDLSTQEKAKLYDAIGYSGNEMNYSEYPVEVSFYFKIVLLLNI